MCEDEYKARLKSILKESDLPSIDDIIADKVAECKGEALGSFLTLEDIFDRDIEDVERAVMPCEPYHSSKSLFQRS